MHPWFTHFSRPAPHAGARLLCLPSSGGGSTLYRPWLGGLEDVELQAALLPGRERRMLEAPVQTMAAMVDGLVPAVTALADRPYFLFGHSMGALIAFELTRALVARAVPLPRRLFVSAFRAPDMPNPKRDLHALPDDEFIDALRDYGGTPEAVLRHRETMDAMLPMLRADFRMHETYRYHAARPLPVPITALAGRADDAVPASQMAGWAKQTCEV
ncbi:alpha/beta fold hydrolase [Pseudoduganella sp. SL102]|uniref:thioesterase II family protein n=1 Tax=Pseudoduganella sp. SL102 TaxID=2995154 RepID=UPI00248AE48E|nr:alpha/beta fold hydrolase [Pseudoduganella sp. SL102]WBS03483.1 alpha/beta fold hydrolase [Pseudoduganella sp. SL102]